MTMAVETEVETQRREVVILREELQRPRESQPQLVAIERDPFDLLEYLREVNRRMADLGRNLRQGPPSRRIACEDEFCPVCEPLPSETPTWDMGGARSQRSSGKRQREAFGFERLRDALSKAVPQ